MPPRPSRRWPWLLAALLILLPLLLASLALQRAPAVAAPHPGADAHLAVQMQRLWSQLRPGAAPPGVLRQLRLGEREFNALLGQLAQTRGGDWRAQVGVQPRALQLTAAQALLAERLWLNLELRWDLSSPQPGRLPPLASARLGHLPLPTALVEPWLLRGAERATGMPVQTLLPMLQGWRAGPGQLWLLWRWEPERAAQVLAARWSPAERAALLAQAQAQLAAPPPPNWVPLGPRLQTMAGLAEQRIATQGSTAAAELRALLTVAALQAMGRSLSSWLPEAQNLPPLPPALVLLAGRDDMALHFLVAAVLTWEGGERAAAAMSLAKELADRRAGSGFSFNDLAADEAGNRFGSLAAREPARVLRQLAQGMQESFFFPAIDDLPEFLSERDFFQRYGELGSPAYEAEMRRIHERVSALPLYRGKSGP